WIVVHYSWRTLFAIVVPFSIFTLLYSIFKLQILTPQRDINFDLLSIILSSFGFGGLPYWISMAGDLGWSNPLVYGTISVGTVALIMMVIRQLRMDEAML